MLYIDGKISIISTAGFDEDAEIEIKLTKNKEHELCSIGIDGTPINAVRWSPDGRYLAAATANGIVYWFKLSASV